MARSVRWSLLLLCWALPAAANAPDSEPSQQSSPAAVRALELCRAATPAGHHPSMACQDLVLALLTDDADLFLTYVDPDEGFVLERRGVETPVRGEGMFRSLLEEDGSLRGLLGVGQPRAGEEVRVDECVDCRTPHLQITLISPNGAVADLEVFGGRIRYVRLSALICQTESGERYVFTDPSETTGASRR